MNRSFIVEEVFPVAASSATFAALTAPLQAYRQALYASFAERGDAQMELIDALLSTPDATAVVELSLSPSFRRHYSNIGRAIAAGTPRGTRREHVQQVWGLIAPYLPRPQRHFWLLGHDATSCPRPFARTLRDRGVVYLPNAVCDNKPVTLGHQYEALLLLPEKPAPRTPPWVVPLAFPRIPTGETEVQVAAELLNAALGDTQLPWGQDLVVDVGDGRYTTVAFLAAVHPRANLVTITRARSNCVFYRPYQAPPDAPPRRGAPPRYGARWALHEPATWGPPDQTTHYPHTTARGRTYTVVSEAWEGLIMHGKRGQRMWDKPFTLVRLRALDAAGQEVFRRPLWLVVLGTRRGELTLRETADAYAHRGDAEHFNRFAKQDLLFSHYQTPDTQHEENWATCVQVAYTQLWLMRGLVRQLPRPWEQYLPQPPAGLATPSQTQRDAARILRQIGTPAQAPQSRGKSAGRPPGTQPPRRPRLAVVKKGKKRAPTA
jgi:hypothetical protein